MLFWILVATPVNYYVFLFLFGIELEVDNEEACDEWINIEWLT